LTARSVAIEMMGLGSLSGASLFAAVEVGSASRGSGSGRVCHLQFPRLLGFGIAGGSGAGHLFAALWRHGVVRPQPGGLNQKGDLADVSGVMTSASSRRGCVRSVSRGVSGQAADFAVAQAVEHEREEFAGRGDPGDVAVVAPLGELAELALEEASPSTAADRLDGRPAHQFRPLLICGPGPRQRLNRVGFGRAGLPLGRAVKAGRRPPGGEALTGPVKLSSSIEMEPRQGFLVAALLGVRAVGRRAPLLISVLGRGPGD
jgi:hypothetical protein